MLTYLWEIHEGFSPYGHHTVLQSYKTVPTHKAVPPNQRHFCTSVTGKTPPDLIDEIVLLCR
jgi:hypothetical protein